MDEQKELNDVLHDPMNGQKPLADVLHDIEEVMNKEPWRKAFDEMRLRPMYYNRDGTPIVGDSRTEAMLKWAAMFEDHKNRIVAITETLYGERLSTVFLGLDHSFMSAGPPILFETMLFAPESDELRKAKRARLHTIADSFNKHDAIEKMEDFPEEKYIETHYPHDNLQERYATEAQAQAGHRRLKLQCLIPPRWRRFLLYTIGKDSLWA